MSSTSRSPETGYEETCRDCGESFRSRNSLTKHIRAEVCRQGPWDSSSSPPSRPRTTTSPQLLRRGRRPGDDDDEEDDEMDELRRENARLRRERNDAYRRSNQHLAALELEAYRAAALGRQLDDEARENDRLYDANVRLRRERNDARRESARLRRGRGAGSEGEGEGDARGRGRGPGAGRDDRAGQRRRYGPSYVDDDSDSADGSIPEGFRDETSYYEGTDDDSGLYSDVPDGKDEADRAENDSLRQATKGDAAQSEDGVVREDTDSSTLKGRYSLEDETVPAYVMVKS